MPISVNITPDAPSGAGPYSQAVRAGDFLFLSGIGSLDVETHEIQGTTAAEQVRITMEHIKTILAAHNATLKDVVKMGLYLQDPDDYEEANAAYAEFFEAPYPARLSVGAGQVWEMKVKLDCIAYLGT